MPHSPWHGNEKRHVLVPIQGVPTAHEIVGCMRYRTVMDRYAYLLLDLFLAIPWVVFFLLRKDLRSKMVRIGIMAGVGVVIVEYFWLLKDYWHPPTAFPFIGSPIIEDFLFGFVISGSIAVCYDVFCNSKQQPATTKRLRLFFAMFALGVLLLVILSTFLQYNSVIVCSIVLLLYALFMIVRRRELFLPSIVAGGFCLLLAAIIYVILFEYMVPDYWHRYWLLYQTPVGYLFGTDIPFTEMLWYVSWGCFGGIASSFANGTRSVK